MRAAARSGCYAQMIAVLSVAEWTYLDWASPHADRAEDLPFWFGEWITLHSGPGFEGVVAYLRGQLDLVWPTLSPEDQAAARSAFVTATRLERAFFDAALAGYPAP